MQIAFDATVLNYLHKEYLPDCVILDVIWYIWMLKIDVRINDKLISILYDWRNNFFQFWLHLYLFYITEIKRYLTRFLYSKFFLLIFVKFENENNFCTWENIPLYGQLKLLISYLEKILNVVSFLHYIIEKYISYWSVMNYFQIEKCKFYLYYLSTVYSFHELHEFFDAIKSETSII